jgi:hypothetical protein
MFAMLLARRCIFIKVTKCSASATYLKDKALCLHAGMHAPQLMHFLLSISTFFFLVIAPTMQTSAHPSHLPLHEHCVHFPSFQQHLL